jgi:ABC-type multidrug transport system fused ATPase/permease subunit
MILSNSARKESTAGQMVNLISINAQSLTDFPTQLHMFWMSIVSIVLTMFILYDLLGVASLAGVLFMILLVPFTSLISSKSKKLQSKQYEYQDSRIKTVNELLNGIKVIKLYAWELPLKSIIIKIRQSELKIFRLISYLTGFNNFVMNTTPFMVYL